MILLLPFYPENPGISGWMNEVASTTCAQLVLLSSQMNFIVVLTNPLATIGGQCIYIHELPCYTGENPICLM